MPSDKPTYLDSLFICQVEFCGLEQFSLPGGGGGGGAIFFLGEGAPLRNGEENKF